MVKTLDLGHFNDPTFMDPLDPSPVRRIHAQALVWRPAMIILKVA
jgi:hypothetical protein